MQHRRELFSPLDPFQTGTLRVSPLHEIYFEVSGNPEGTPVVVCHGGPGGGTTPAMRRYFDPEAYRIILFDQRGCGRSRPYASLEDNTTWHLVEDMEHLRIHLGIERWHLFGGSWGSTLALAYGQTHPERVRSFILRGIFMLRQRELAWFYQGGADWFFPDAWEEYCEAIPREERSDMIAAYYRRLTSADREIQAYAARAWSRWEAQTVSLLPAPDRVENFSAASFALAFARIECHYFVNRGFFESDSQLLDQVDRIRHIPAEIIQGRYDVVTPMRSAWDLYRAWPEADLCIVSDAGHAASEPGIVSALISATSRFADLD